MALVGNTFFVADSDAVLSFPYHSGDTEIKSAATELTALPAGTINHHWTKSLLASPDGQHLYVGVGSNSNAAENGLDAERERAAVWQIDIKTGKHRLYASGLRNPVGLAWQPQSGALWVAVNERDELGNQVPPDYMTALHDGGFYGWPFSYYGQQVDDRVKPQNPALVATALVPDYALGAHTASLGLAWSGRRRFAAALSAGDVRRTARLVESKAAQRLQGDFRSLRKLPPGWAADRRTHGILGCGQSRAGPPRRRRDR